ncbi:MAG: phosphoribosyltransferase [Planctomycetes bacterium]|nr:phosphoribosyltransferase [Planctomycetota bacterium]
MYFRDRFEAGQFLAEKLHHFAGRPDVLVLALPRGGVPVAFEVAKALHAPMDVFLVRKLGVPGHEELAMGAVANGNIVILNDEVTKSLRIPDDVIETVARQERETLTRQRQMYRDDKPASAVRDCVVILIDDGLATGSTMRAAVAALRKQRPKRVIVAVPVGAPDTCAAISGIADEVLCAIRPEHFMAVGAWYDDFSPTSDQTVRALLDEASHWTQAETGGSSR